jgi:mono/diheme cytochrome c family protein
MTARFFHQSVAALATLFALGAALHGQQDRTMWSGVYTGDQAARGKPVFEASCGRCHNNELVGSARGPALKGAAFLSKYENDTLAGLFTFVRDRMPQDGPGLVADGAKLDILAYLLQRNDVPAGAKELALDQTTLESIKLSKRGIWDGVFTAAQAERGKEKFLQGRCGGCHQLDLSGDRGPALKGDAFLSRWENDSLAMLFKKISETMPPNSPNETPDDAKIDIVAYLLQSNGFPAGPGELRLEEKALASVDLVKKGAPSTPNFSLVQTIGCLMQGPSNAWTLARASTPALTREDRSASAALGASASRALGTETLQLISISSFKPEAHQGQKMEARGLLYRDEKGALLNLTSLEMLDQSCQN